MAVLKVIRASAGSGKTFRLTTEYLALLFHDPDYFMHILAVTFTNKATEEMKTRIVRELWLLSGGRESDQLQALTELTGLTESSIRSRSGTILKKILHQYSRFSISTIDSFFQRIIRSFTHELGIQGGYSIELDVDAVITVLVDRLLTMLEKDRSLLMWLSRYAEALIEQGESWNFRNSLQRLGKEIFREELRQKLDAMMVKFSDRDFLGKFQTDLSASLAKQRRDYRSIGQKAVLLIESKGLHVDDFAGKSRGPAGFLYKVASGDFRQPGTVALEASEQIEKWYRKDDPEAGRIRDACETGLLSFMQQAVGFHASHGREMNTSEQVMKNLFTLGILSDLFRLVSEYCNENSVFLLAEASSFLSLIIRDNDTPFIYEKAGYWYHHFMIDEFQDTSRMQWDNFKPLISNSLSQEYDNLLVGDAKQSIYRWRNSNWEILAGDIAREYRPEVLEIMALQKNFRSGDRIVAFNNAFFSMAAEQLQHDFNRTLEDAGHDDVDPDGISILDIYADVRQEPGRKNLPGGCVQVDFLEEDENQSLDDLVAGRLIGQICALQDKGYKPGQVAIITRKNAEAEQLAEALLRYRNEHPEDEHSFDVISDEALQLSSSTAVSFLVALLQYLAHPEDILNRYQVVSEYLNYLGDEGPAPAYVSPEIFASTEEDGFSRIMPPAFLRFAEAPGGSSLTETVEQLLSLFKLDRIAGEIAYIHAFQDLVLEYSRKFSPDLTGFLAYWEETGRRKSVAAPAGQDAIRILTIHKSKGLEFDIVILPYCNWALDSGRNTILWCDAGNVTGCELEVVPVMYSSRLRDTYFSGAYFSELRKQHVDNLNLLYVAFTRARKGLFLYCSKGKKDRLQNVADLVMNVLAGREGAVTGNPASFSFDECFQEPGGSFVYGSLPAPVNVDDGGTNAPLMLKYVPPGQDQKVSERLKVAFQGNLYLDVSQGPLVRPVNHGKIMHEVFSRIRNAGDVAAALDRICLEGKIDLGTRNDLHARIERLFQDIQILSWFSGDWKVLNETEIILPGGHVRRPDRVLIREDRAIVIDFKFGHKSRSADEKQVRDYMGLISAMGYGHVEGYLWYVELEKVQQVA